MEYLYKLLDQTRKNPVVYAWDETSAYDELQKMQNKQVIIQKVPAVYSLLAFASSRFGDLTDLIGVYDTFMAAAGESERLIRDELRKSPDDDENRDLYEDP